VVKRVEREVGEVLQEYGKGVRSAECGGRSAECGGRSERGVHGDSRMLYCDFRAHKRKTESQ
jgi:hypothetical protein